MNIEKYDVVVIGAGPAGMMAAIRSGKSGLRTLLVEKNALPGRKLILTGNGRCNYTNSAKKEDFLGRYGPNGDFLRDAFKVFFREELVGFLEENGIGSVEEENGRIFPLGKKAGDVLSALTRAVEGAGVECRFSSRVDGIKLRDGAVNAVTFAGDRILGCGAVVVATGGVSYPGTGSTGDGLRIAGKSGHGIVTPRPGLVPVISGETGIAGLEGISLYGIRVKGPISFSKYKLPGTGDVMFTRSGLSGPLILALSGQISETVEKKGELILEMDLEPALNGKQIEDRIMMGIKGSGARSVKNLLRTWYPERLVLYIMDKARIDADRRSAQMTKEERAGLIRNIKSMRVRITGTAPVKEAMVTRGGVSLKDIDPRTMGSRRVKGLYFAGEVMDIDGDTGGFNLQAAFSTGYLAGESASKRSRGERDV
ncbi:MAG: NAD(P)/FAD-dependent oxidoreductase [Candidatus Omnitrophica bacterium]|nr:NAD(P)/FAD-dependent oxidoreductase [Candidatus Omnitrophota bacterium]MDD5487848.1 NAD(P)/FAD-dependent oxidoreductase [Candidatus Omnitrophota bacterium]